MLRFKLYYGISSDILLYGVSDITIQRLSDFCVKYLLLFEPRFNDKEFGGKSGTIGIRFMYNKKEYQ